jgi:hypothetical protein
MFLENVPKTDFNLEYFSTGANGRNFFNGMNGPFRCNQSKHLFSNVSIAY